MDAFRRTLGPVLDGEAGSIRQCDDAARRLRELAPLLAAELGTVTLRPTRVRLRRLGRAIEPVRNVEVAIGLLERWDGAARVGSDVMDRVHRHLLAARLVARQRLGAQVGPAQVAELDREARAIATALEVATPGAWSRTLSLRMTQCAQRLRAVVEAAGALYLPDRTHAVRGAAEKLRFAFELACDAGASRRRVPAARLGQVEDRLARLHDLELLSALIQEVSPSPGVVGDEQLHDLRRQLGEECRRLHGAFISQRRQVVHTCGAALDMAIQLWNRPAQGGQGVAPVKMTLDTGRSRRQLRDRRAVSR